MSDGCINVGLWCVGWVWSLAGTRWLRGSAPWVLGSRTCGEFCVHGVRDPDPSGGIAARLGRRRPRRRAISVRVGVSTVGHHRESRRISQSGGAGCRDVGRRRASRRRLHGWSLESDVSGPDTMLGDVLRRLPFGPPQSWCATTPDSPPKRMLMRVVRLDRSDRGCGRWSGQDAGGAVR